MSYNSKLKDKFTLKPCMIVFLSSNKFHCQIQVSVLADEILKNVEFDALRVVFNRFQSVVQFLPTISTILSAEVYESEKNSYL